MKQLRYAMLGALVAIGIAGCAKQPLYHQNFLYTAVGTSDVLGVGAFPLSNGYTFRIQRELRERGRNAAIIQAGVPGANADIVANNLRKATDNGLDAEFATVWVGANDLINGVPAQTFAESLNELLSLLQDEIGAYVVIANLPQMQNFPNYLQEPVTEVSEQRVAQFNGVINGQAIARGITVVNLADDGISDNLAIDFDGLHPDDSGHERLSQLFMNVIRPDL